MTPAPLALNDEKKSNIDDKLPQSLLCCLETDVTEEMCFVLGEC